MLKCPRPLRSVVALTLPKDRLIGVILVSAVGLPLVIGTVGAVTPVSWGQLAPALLFVFAVGVFLLAPIVAVLGERLSVVESTYRRPPEEVTVYRADPVERLRQRYAEGELSDLEFERRLGRLVGTETEDGIERLVRGGESDDVVEEFDVDGVDLDLDLDLDGE